MEKERFMKNTVTGVIFRYRAEDMQANSKLVECTEDGVIFGKSTVPVDELYARIAELERIVAEKDIRIAALENAISSAAAEKTEKKNTETKELEDLKVDDLKTLAVDLGINIDGMKKADIIAAIIAKKE
jgi:uncharacterized small protein (DUF1192 family)